MGFEHDVLVLFSKSWGLFYLIAVFIGVLIYALRPSMKNKFDRAANSILEDQDEDRPCQ